MTQNLWKWKEVSLKGAYELLREKILPGRVIGIPIVCGLVGLRKFFRFTWRTRWSKLLTNELTRR